VNVFRGIVRSNSTPAQTTDQSDFVNVVVTPLNTCSHGPDSGPYFVLHELNLYTLPLFYAQIAFLKEWAQMELGVSKK